MAKLIIRKEKLLEPALKTRVAVVIPAYNVQDTVEKVVEEAKKNVDEVIVINDGSHDNTPQLLANHVVTVVEHKKNQGLGCALRRGFSVALEKDFDIVVTMDSDGQHEPEDIRKLVDKLIAEKADAVIGSRLLDKSQWNNFPKHRLLGNRILTFLTNLASGKKATTDSQSGFRAIKLEAIKKLELGSKRMAISSEIIFELVSKGFKVGEVPIKATYDKEISNVKAVSDISHILWLLLKKRLSLHKSR